MTDTADYDQLAKAVGKLLDDWGKVIEKIGEDLADVQDQIDQMEELKKQREQLKKDAEKASKELASKILAVPVPPKVDPQQLMKLPSFITKLVDDNGVKLGPNISLMPNIKIDPKKPSIEKFGLTLTVKWK